MRARRRSDEQTTSILYYGCANAAQMRSCRSKRINGYKAAAPIGAVRAWKCQQQAELSERDERHVAGLSGAFIADAVRTTCAPGRLRLFASQLPVGRRRPEREQPRRMSRVRQPGVLRSGRLERRQRAAGQHVHRAPQHQRRARQRQQRYVERRQQERWVGSGRAASLHHADTDFRTWGQSYTTTAPCSISPPRACPHRTSRTRFLRERPFEPTTAGRSAADGDTSGAPAASALSSTRLPGWSSVRGNVLEARHAPFGARQ